jgi:hypothetical protein
VQPEIGQSMPCPQCEAPGEPEQDGQAVYFSCPECFAEYGYRVIRAPQLCAAGLEISPGPPPGAPVFLATTITRRPQ